MANSDVETGRLCALVWEMKNILWRFHFTGWILKDMPELVQGFRVHQFEAFWREQLGISLASRTLC